MVSPEITDIVDAEEHQLRVYKDYVVANLGRILDMRFQPPFSCPSEEYLAKTFRNAESAFSRGEIEGARHLILVNAKLLQNLLTVQNYDPELLDEFKKDLHRVEIDGYFGVHREIETARSLIINGYSFQHPDPPDFEITHQGNELAIECTGSRVVNSTEYRQKICDVINEKSKKDYSKGTTALFLDVTDLFYSDVENGGNLSKEKLKEGIREDVEIFGWELGSILLWSYVYDESSKEFHHAYIRTDTQNIETELRSFLNQNYPLEEFSPDNWQIPSQN